MAAAQCPVPAASSAEIAAAAARGQHFGSIETLNVDLVATVRSMQEHVRMVSLPSDAEVRAELAANGFTLVGDLITGSADDGMRAYVAVRGDELVVVFRGTKVVGDSQQMLANIRTDLQAGQVPMDWLSPPADAAPGAPVMVHAGFSGEWRSVRDEVYARISQYPDSHVSVYGHSLGAGLGTLAALDIATTTGQDVTFIGSGSPRVGNDAFRDAFETAVPDSLRVVVGNDVVPRIPAVRDYEHVGRLLIVDQQGQFIALDDIQTVPKLIAGWPEHNNAVYRDVSARLLEQTQASPDFLAGRQGVLSEAGDAERASHRPLQERFGGLAD